MARGDKPKMGAKAKTGKAASKLNIEETISSSDESVESQSSNRKMAAKPTKTSTKTKQPTPKAKSLPKDTPNRPKQPDPPTIDSDQVEVLQIIPPPYPARPAKATKMGSMKYYKQRAYYYQRKFEGAKSDISDCSDISYSSSEEERGITYHYEIKDSKGITHNKTNLDSRGKIAYHKVRDKTLLDFVENK